jgi:UDP-N-acetylmuramoyl-tripeptide--D-alanyl-D-alanine ligase
VITLTAEQAGEALGRGALRSPVQGVSIDSRTLRPGDLFVALRGERFDGHEYVDAAFAAGASGAVVEAAVWRERGVRPEPADGPVYQVADTLLALGALARAVRRASGARVFAVTGSAGKTSTKDVLKAMLGRLGPTIATAGNQNNEVGVPLTLLTLESGAQAAVVEMGMRGRGQIAQLAEVAEPDVGVITNVHPVHLELLGTLDNVAQAKAELVRGLGRSEVGVVPAGCTALEPHLESCTCRLVRFKACTGPAETRSGDAAGADVLGWLDTGDDGRPRLALRWPGGETSVATGYMSAHAVENAVAAAAACYAAGLPVAECVAGLADVELSQGRGQVSEAGGVCVIDDTYNANPAAVRAALDHLVLLASRRQGRAVAVLGDMLELGPLAEKYHHETGEYAALAGVSVLWGVGPLSEATVQGFEHGLRDGSGAGGERDVRHVPSAEQAESVIEELRPGDVVLVKGSRGIRLEKVVIRLMREGKAGRWSGGAADVEVDSDLTEEKRHCSE